MSNVVKLSLKTKKIKAFVPDKDEIKTFSDDNSRVKEVKEDLHKKELESEYLKGYENGRIETTKLLEEKHSEEILTKTKEFYSILSSFENQFKIFENRYHKIVIEVAKKISEKIIVRELNEETSIEKILEQNLKKIIGANDITIKLNPKDLAVIENDNQNIIKSAGFTKVRFEQSDNIEIGGCLIESEIGTIDARIKSQINEIVKALENNLIENEIE
ncbi:MAG: hypothetical protein CR986_01550 [Ignavibacteriae bacterium]|nr:MAG: hypothetical protein CR986_01550 [Ignavibacteriota bacterium]